MWEYKIVRLMKSEFEEMKQKIQIVKDKVNSDFKDEFPNWGEEKKQMTEEKVEQFLDIKYYGLIRDCIINIYPHYKGKGRDFSFDQYDYLQYKLNENGINGWELDKIRLNNPQIYNDGILILKRKI